MSAQAEYNKFCCQGSVIKGLNWLKEKENGSSCIRKLIRRIENRIFKEEPALRLRTGIKWIRQVLKAYAGYYNQVLTLRLSHEIAEQKLASRLVNCFPEADSPDINKLEVFLQQKFAGIGWYFLGGITSPYRGPYIYESQRKQVFHVELPETTRQLNVFFMESFHSLSWLDYATFGKCGTGGWAKPDGLFCVSEKYDVSRESFKVSYLKHEAQHVDDYERFPFLKTGCQSLLEFRAKLVELIYAESVIGISKFCNEAVADTAYPHLFASYRLVDLLARRLKTEKKHLEASEFFFSSVKSEAMRIYLENSSELEAGNHIGSWLK